jgi:hypothetical protein
MDDDLTSPVTDYNSCGHTTIALKNDLPTLYIYSNPIEIHATHVNYMYKYPSSLFVLTLKNVERGQCRMTFYFLTNITVYNNSFPIKSAFLPPFRIGKLNLSELCSDNMHFKLIDMNTKDM